MLVFYVATMDFGQTWHDLSTKFHKEKLSGKSEYLLGIPDNPKKCWGKNVKLTPIKVIQKCIFP